MSGPQLARLQEATDQMMWHVADAEQRRHFRLKHPGGGTILEGSKVEVSPSEIEQSGGAESDREAGSHLEVRTGGSPLQSMQPPSCLVTHRNFCRLTGAQTLSGVLHLSTECPSFALCSGWSESRIHMQTHLGSLCSLRTQFFGASC